MISIDLQNVHSKRKIRRLKPDPSDKQCGMDVDKDTNGLGLKNILKSVRLVNFMCHEHLYVEFGRINFIIGQNGSGKSAILTAIMICLGARVNKTQRGHKISTLIMENKEYASICVIFNNDRIDEYCPEVYGREIHIERRILRNGSSFYKTKDYRGRLVSAKKEEIISICDHFKLQVDNPIVMLTQNSAKDYLANSSSESKYELFLNGTYLSQLEKDYHRINGNIQKMEMFLSSIRSNLVILESDIETFNSQIEHLKIMRNIHEKIENTKKEMAWAYVHEKKREIVEKQNEIAGEETRLEDLTKEKNNLAGRIDEIQSKLKGMEEQNNVFHLEVLQPLETSIAQISSQLATISTQIRKIDSNETFLKGSLAESQESSKSLRVLVDNKNMDDGVIQKKTTQIHADMNETEEKRRRVEEDLAQNTSRISTMEKEMVEKKKMLLQIEKNENEFWNYKRFVDNKITQIKESKHDHNKIYGASIPRLLAYLSSDSCGSRGFISKPIGPIGIHVKLKDMTWNVALDAIIGRFLSSFVVDTYEDREILKQILKEFHCDNQVILRMNKSCDSREPPAHYLTAFRVCIFDEEIVSNTLKLLTNFERIILCKSRNEAMAIVTENNNVCPPNTDSIFTMDAAKITFGASSISFFSYGHQNRKTSFFEDKDTQLEILRNELKEKTKIHDKNTIEKFNLEKEIEQMNDNIRLSELERTRLEEYIGSLVLQVKRLKNKLETEYQNTDRDAINEQLFAYNEKIKEYEGRLGDLEEERNELHRRRITLQEQHDAANKKYESSKITFDENKKLIDGCYHQRNELEGDTCLLMSRIKKINQDTQNSRNFIKPLHKEYENIREKALEYCSEVQTERTIEDINTELIMLERKYKTESLSKNLDVGDINRILVDLKSARKKQSEIKSEIAQLEKIIDKFTKSAKNRQNRWIDFRDLICTASNIYFTWFMTRRGLVGKLTYDHVNKKLCLSVRHQESGDDSRDNDVKSLSGGEKSISLVCFLLSLWESIETPIRCLDEFDVFMDNVNRQAILDLLLTYAKSCASMQFVFITPQTLDLSDIHKKDAKVIRMSDPERNNT